MLEIRRYPKNVMEKKVFIKRFKAQLGKRGVEHETIKRYAHKDAISRYETWSFADFENPCEDKTPEAAADSAIVCYTWLI